MLSEGETAPPVSLPGYVDGERERVDLGEYLGEEVVVLAFSPADFSPACTARESDLDGLDLLTMQKDVAVFAVSPDSTYSHAAFAERYSLTVPLLSDADGEAAAAYGVARETEAGESLPRRAVFVVDHHGTVRYARATDDLEERLDVDPVRRAVEGVADDETALERYWVGHERHAEAREAFEAAMAEYENGDWALARAGFREAEPAFAAATDEFGAAARFAETAAVETVADRAGEKADALGRAADWLAESADALGNGRGAQGADYREDAEGLLATADGLPDPPGPGAFTLTDEGVVVGESVDLGGDRDPAREGDVPGLDVDTGALEAADGESESSGGEDSTDSGVEGDAIQGDLELDLDATGAADDTGDRDTADDGGRSGSVGPGGDRAAARAGDAAPTDASGDGGSNETSDGRETAGAAGGSDGSEGTGEDEVVEELDLADPTEDDDGDDGDDWDIPGQ